MYATASRRAGALARFAPVVLATCLACAPACDRQGSTDWTIVFASGVRARAVRVVAQIRDGDCAESGSERYSAILAAGESSLRPPELGRGHYAFEAVAVDEQCVAFAEDCVSEFIDAADHHVTNTLVASTEHDLCARSWCSSGECGEPRDGGSEAGDADGGDDAVADGSPEADASGRDCWCNEPARERCAGLPGSPGSQCGASSCYGDIDGSGSVNVLDVSLVIDCLKGLIPCDCADVNRDDVIDCDDVSAMVCLTGLPPDPTACCLQ